MFTLSFIKYKVDAYTGQKPLVDAVQLYLPTQTRIRFSTSTTYLPNDYRREFKW